MGSRTGTIRFRLLQLTMDVRVYNVVVQRKSRQ
jgi:hypothetical protein